MGWYVEKCISYLGGLTLTFKHKPKPVKLERVYGLFCSFGDDKKIHGIFHQGGTIYLSYSEVELLSYSEAQCLMPDAVIAMRKIRKSVRVFSLCLTRKVCPVKVTNKNFYDIFLKRKFSSKGFNNHLGSFKRV